MVDWASHVEPMILILEIDSDGMSLDLLLTASLTKHPWLYALSQRIHLCFKFKQKTNWLQMLVFLAKHCFCLLFWVLQVNQNPSDVRYGLHFYTGMVATPFRWSSRKPKRRWCCVVFVTVYSSQTVSFCKFSESRTPIQSILICSLVWGEDIVKVLLVPTLLNMTSVSPTYFVLLKSSTILSLFVCAKLYPDVSSCTRLCHVRFSLFWSHSFGFEMETFWRKHHQLTMSCRIETDITIRSKCPV